MKIDHTLGGVSLREIKDMERDLRVAEWEIEDLKGMWDEAKAEEHLFVIHGDCSTKEANKKNQLAYAYHALWETRVRIHQAREEIAKINFDYESEYALSLETLDGEIPRKQTIEQRYLAKKAESNWHMARVELGHAKDSLKHWEARMKEAKTK